MSRRQTVQPSVATSRTRQPVPNKTPPPPPMELSTADQLSTEEAEKKEMVQADSQSTPEEKALVSEQKKKGVANWKIALAVGVGATVLTVGTVLYIRHRRFKQMRAKRYSTDEEETAESMSEKLGRWWNLSTSVFTSVRSVTSRFLSKSHSPMMSSEKAASGFTNLAADDDQVADF